MTVYFFAIDETSSLAGGSSNQTEVDGMCSNCVGQNVSESPKDGRHHSRSKDINNMFDTEFDAHRYRKFDVFFFIANKISDYILDSNSFKLIDWLNFK